MRSFTCLLALAALAACNDDKSDDTSSGGGDDTGDTVDTDDTAATDDTGETGPQDLDGDGYADDVDCDDNDATVYPGAPETCDGVDEDCDGVVDEEAVDAETWYTDADEDGYPAEGAGVLACEQPPGLVPASSKGWDCDDSDPAFHPGAEESDCTDPNDYNCDGSVGYADADADGWPACEDCDDGDASAYPGGTETCDGTDEDCDGDVDEEAVDASTWYADTDGDGDGDTGFTQVACDQPSGYVADDSDCDDTSASVNPAATETCNGVDDDCSGDVDDGAVDAATWYGDGDGDGYGDATLTTAACEQPTGYAAAGTDCDDANPAVNPGATEVCNGVDDDCSGDVDSDAVDIETWYGDADGDGYGDAAVSTTVCAQPTGYVDEGTDCDDTDAAVNPAAEEVCDEVDNDCDGTADIGATDGLTWYEDADGDEYGDSAITLVACEQPTGYAGEDGDCDDSDAAVGPAATEVCDGIDNNCDGNTDGDATDKATWYADSDSDGYGDASTSQAACAEPAGYVGDATDCDDTDGAVNPGATEVCNGVDDDCDGDADGGATDAGTWYTDGDGDGFGEDGATTVACTAPSGTADEGGDCDDEDPAVNPDAEEVCNDGLDNDCDGSPGACMLEGTLPVASADAAWYGVAASDSAGKAVAFAGDVDGDGRDDALVGAWSNDTAANNAGTVYLLLGPATTGGDLSAADATFTGASSSDYLGFAASTAGDQNDDGFDDVLLGAYGSNAGATDGGSVYLFYGPATGSASASAADVTLTCSVASQYFGASVASRGDVDDDGVVDLAIGGSGRSGTDAGGAWIFYGPVTTDGTYADAGASFAGAAAGDNAGRAVSIGGDVDGDGYADLTVGAHASDAPASNAGAAYVFFGPVTGSHSLSAADATFTGGSSNDYAGWAVAIVPDLDGDGVDDLAVGVYGQDSGTTNAGTTYVIAGPVASGSSTLASAAKAAWSGTTAGDWTGYAVAGAGDVDGDGAGDLLIGGPTANTAATDAGVVYLLYGPMSGTASLSGADLTITGTNASDTLGRSVAGRGDADGDGYLDLLMGADGESTNGTEAGAAWIVLGLGY